MTIKQGSYSLTAQQIIKHLERRNMTGSFAVDKADALEQVKAFLQPGVTVACGGSESVAEIGLFEAVEQSESVFLSRFDARKDRAVAAQIMNCDVFFMSTNAITLDGQLVNIDGAGDRLSRLLWGPSKVVIVAGMNKVAKNVDEAIDRVHMKAAPPNALRLGKKSPCGVTGVCADCLGPECMCCQTVITRKSMVPGRIHVILVGEELGY